MNAGTQIAHYKIIRPLGKGGMGEVYLAEDTRLKRQVAIKVLPESLRGSPDRLARFRTEAEAAARLKHPNIAPIFALEDAEGQLFIVMEYVEGQPLYAHIPQDGMDLETFFSTFIPLSDALAHAHTHDVTHRDLKPGNIMIAEDGTPKILDFGLARITRPDPEEAPSDAVDSDAPTMTMDPNAPLPHPQTPPKSLTEGMQFMGTPAYMSPEQAQRQRVDHRTDLFSLGVVMYEALTGKRPFQGDTLESLIGHILVADPEPVTQVKPVTPYTLWQVVRTCLRKDRDERTQTARRLHADLRDVQQEVTAGAVLVDASAMLSPEPVPFWRQPIPIVVTIMLMVVTGLVVRMLNPHTEASVRKFQIAGADTRGNRTVALSPDGTMIAYVADEKLWIRELAVLESRTIPDSQGAGGLFWSPDSDFLGYAVANTLWKVSVRGGSPVKLCELPGNNEWDIDATWGTAGTIVCDSPEGLMAVSYQGGDPQLMLQPDSSTGEWQFASPHFLPDGHTLLFVARKRPDTDEIVVQVGDSRQILISQVDGLSARPVYSPTGHLVYHHGGAVRAQPFDLSKLTVTGTAFPVAGRGVQPSVSIDGTLVYTDTETNLHQLVWVNRDGRVEGPIGEPQYQMYDPALSPDGTLVAVRGNDESGDYADIWIHDSIRHTKTRLTFDPGHESQPVWHPDGSQIGYTGSTAGLDTSSIFTITADGSDQPRMVVSGTPPVWGPHWSSNGKYLAYYFIHDAGTAELNRDIWYMPVDGTREPVPLLTTRYNEGLPRFSPDGRYLAYQSDDNGRQEIYLTTFPAGDMRRKISVSGGVHPKWNGRGDELYFVTGDSLMVVNVRTRPVLRLGLPRMLFTGEQVGGPLTRTNLFQPVYDVATDGRRFVVVRPVEQGEGASTITVVQNWYKEFETSP